MDTNHHLFTPSNHKNSNEEQEEDYIDMELVSTTTTSSSSPQSREFEFQMASISNDSNSNNNKETTTSPADELFYRGKLLPLHLPPRLEMVQKLLQTSKIESFLVQQQQEVESTKNLTNPNTPYESCNISPSDSCRVSCELNPDEYFFEWSTEFNTFINDHPKKYSWSKKLKLIKQSLLSQKFKSSRTYLKSLFHKTPCSEQVSNVKDCSNKYISVSKTTPFGHITKCTQPTLANVMKNSIDNEGVDENVCNVKDGSNKYIKVFKKTPFGQVTKLANVIKNIEGVEENGVNNNHRRSFSAAIKRHSPTKCLSSSTSSCSSSSSFSMNSTNGFYELNLLKRSSSATSEIEGSIQEAIAHCKKSQELCHPRRKLNDGGFSSLSISKIAASESQERSDLCRF